MSKLTVFLIRAAAGLLGGFALWHFFFRQTTPWWTFLVLAVIVVAAAYASEIWRLKKKLDDQQP
jgi:drug/metabolite transporter superfamily protein YnfA